MRIVHLACVAPPESGGIGQAAYDEVIGLRARGVEAMLVSGRGSFYEQAHSDAENNIIIKRLPTILRIGNAALVQGLSAAIRDADIIHLHYPWYGVAERVLWSKSNKPVIVTFHMDALANDWRGTLFSLHRRVLQSHLLKNATKILVSSRDYAEHSSLAPLLPTLGDKVIELPFGLDTNFFSPPSPETRYTHSVDKAKALTVLFVGGLDKAHEFKGLPILLQAMTKLDASVQLVVIGEGDQRPVFETYAEQHGIAHRVLFRGRMTREELRDAYRAAHVLAVPSTSSAEAFGLVALEAQACGTPVVASRWPGVRTLVRDQETGRLVTPGSVEELAEVLQSLLNNSEVCEAYGKNARIHSLQTYSQQVHIDKLGKLYKDSLI